MSATRPKTAAEINVETVNRYINTFIDRTKHLLDAKLEPPLVKPDKPEWRQDFTLNKSNEELAEANYAHHAAAALHFIASFKEKSVTEILSKYKLLLNRFLFLQAFHKNSKVSYGFAPRVVDEKSLLLVSEFLIIINGLAALEDPFNGFVGSTKRWFLEKFAHKTLVDDLKDYLRIIKNNIENEIGEWNKAHPKKPMQQSSVAVVMTAVPVLRQLPPASVPVSVPSATQSAATPAPIPLIASSINVKSPSPAK